MRHKPSIVVHGGAGSISRANFPPDSPSYTAYTSSLRNILEEGHRHLRQTNCALETAVHVVTLFEDNPLFNCAKGSVFNRAGKVECEASLMVCDVEDDLGEGKGREKRGVGVAMLRRTKNPIKLAKEVLLRWGEEVEAGAGRHGFLSGEEVERLGEKWGCDVVEEGYFWTERRWKEHLRGLEGTAPPSTTGSGTAAPLPSDSPTLNPYLPEDAQVPVTDLLSGSDYLPQGTVGCVVMDTSGLLVVATSTGGLTNKTPGRIGDTPTLGAGFWAEAWTPAFFNPPLIARSPRQSHDEFGEAPKRHPPVPPERSRNASLGMLLDSYLPTSWRRDTSAAATQEYEPLPEDNEPEIPRRRAIAISGTGNGDYFLRLCAAHSVLSRCKWAGMTLGDAITEVVGPEGEMQQAAEDVGRWGKGDGEGGFIGIDESGEVYMDLNCGGMFRGYIDEDGEARVAVFADEEPR